jgi:hypothetical protein
MGRQKVVSILLGVRSALQRARTSAGQSKEMARVPVGTTADIVYTFGLREPIELRLLPLHLPPRFRTLEPVVPVDAGWHGRDDPVADRHIVWEPKRDLT